MQVKLVLVFLAFNSLALARNIRCPTGIATDSLFVNKLSPSKYFRCSPLRLLEELECNDGEFFDPEILMCHKPISGRCACPETTPCPATTTDCPCPTTTPCPTIPPTTTTTTTTACPTDTPCPCPTTTPCPCPTTTTPCPCPPETPCPQAIQPYVVPCENCKQGELGTQMPVFLVTNPPVLSFDVFGVRDVPFGAVIVTDPPPPPC